MGSKRYNLLVKKRIAGIRHAKEHLSALVRDVKEGHEWIISDRGVPVARLVPAKTEPEPLDSWLRRMEETGMIEPRTEPQRPLSPLIPLEPAGIAQKWLQEDRDDDRLLPSPVAAEGKDLA